MRSVASDIVMPTSAGMSEHDGILDPGTDAPQGSWGMTAGVVRSATLFVKQTGMDHAGEALWLPELQGLPEYIVCKLFAQTSLLAW